MLSLGRARGWRPFIAPVRRIWPAWPCWVVLTGVPGDCGIEPEPWLPSPELLADTRWLATLP